MDGAAGDLDQGTAFEDVATRAARLAKHLAPGWLGRPSAAYNYTLTCEDNAPSFDRAPILARTVRIFNDLHGPPVLMETGCSLQRRTSLSVIPLDISSALNNEAFRHLTRVPAPA